MKILSTASLLAAALTLGITTFAQGQAVENALTPKTRAQVKMERADFVKTRIFLSEVGWVLKPGM